MKRPKPGVVIEVPTSKGFFYGIVTHRHEWGDVVCFWKSPFAVRSAHFPDFDDPDMLITKQCILKGELEIGEVLSVGTMKIPKSLEPFPLFRSGTPHHEGKIVEVWWLWDGKNEVRIGELNEEQKKLPRAGAADNQFLVSFLQGDVRESLL